MFVVETIGHSVVEMPPGFDAEDPASLAAMIDQCPLAALISVLVAYLLGSGIGGFVAAKLARPRPRVHAHIVGGLFLTMGILNLVMIPHPLWFAVASVLVFAPAAHVGGTLASRHAPR